MIYKYTLKGTLGIFRDLLSNFKGTTSLAYEIFVNGSSKVKGNIRVM